MQVRRIGRVAVDRWLHVARIPLDAAAHVLPEGRGPRNAARFAIGRADAKIRAVIGDLLNDQQLRDEASRRLAAVDERQRAVALHAGADERKRDTDAHLGENLDRGVKLREAAERDAERQRKAVARTTAQRKQQVKRAAAAQASEVDEALDQRLAANDTKTKRERLKVLDEQTASLDGQTDALTARDEAQRLAKAARDAKAARKGTA